MASRPRKNFAQRRKMSLQEFRQQVVESESQLSSIWLEMPDGSEFEIPHPMLIDDEAQKRLEVVQQGRDLDRDEAGEIAVPLKVDGEFAEPASIRTAKALLGDKHADFIAKGGHSNDVILAWNLLVKEHKAIEDADPK